MPSDASDSFAYIALPTMRFATSGGTLSYPTGPDAACPTDPDALASFLGTLKDPSCPVVHSANSPLIVLLIVVTASAALLTLLHYVQRRQRFKKLKPAAATALAADAEAATEGAASPATALIPFGDDMHAQGYVSSPLGRVALAALLCFYAQWLGLYLVILVDYYWSCQLTGLNNMCFYGSYPVFGNFNRNSVAMMATWWCSLFSYVHLLLFAHSLLNFYRLPCDAARARHLAILLPPDAETIVVPHPRFLVRKQRELRAWLARGRGGAKHGGWQTVPVCRTARGTCYVEFKCRRYVLRDGRFAKAESQLVGTPLSTLVAGAGGADPERRAALLEQIGPNHIAFAVDALPLALRKEFFTYFYLYQFQLYVLWLWFSYLFVALALVSVVLLAGLANVAIARSAQRKAAALAPNGANPL